METGNYCAYNVTRNALLSDRVTVAEAALGSLQILGLVMHGPGAHQESAVWLTGFARPPELPRLAAFDILYLDESDCIIACGSVGQDTDYPEFHQKATSALILPERRLADTGTVPGDQLKICTQQDFPAIVKAASQPAMEIQENSASPEPVRVAETALRFEVIRPAHYVFEPFVGTLMYMPDFPEPQPCGAEIFLPQAQPDRSGEAVGEITQSRELPAEAQDQPHMPPGLIPIEQPQSRLKKRTSKPPPEPKELPHFAHPDPIRFFDPAAGASPDTPESQEPAPRSPGIELSPELKLAILQIDELHRQNQSSKQSSAAKKNAAKPKTQAETSIEASVSSGADDVPITPQAYPAAEPVVPEPPAIPVAASMQSTAPHIPQPVAPPVDALPGIPSVNQPSVVTSPPEQHTEFPSYSGSCSISPDFQPEPSPESEPAEAVSALAETTAEIGLIEASLSAASEPTPEIPTTTIRPVFGKPESAATTPPVPAKPTSAQRIGEQPATPETEKTAKREKPAKPKLPLSARILRWLDANPLDGKRRGERVHQPGLVAFYWSGGAPRPHEIANISKSGFYLRTRELWALNTLVRMTLQRPSAITRERESISVLARVVRVDDEGVGHEFVTTEDLMALRSREVLPESGTDRAQLDSFLNLQ